VPCCDRAIVPRSHSTWGMAAASREFLSLSIIGNIESQIEHAWHHFIMSRNSAYTFLYYVVFICNGSPLVPRLLVHGRSSSLSLTPNGTARKHKRHFDVLTLAAPLPAARSQRALAACPARRGSLPEYPQHSVARCIAVEAGARQASQDGVGYCLRELWGAGKWERDCKQDFKSSEM
jgi:hypothetical protein